MEKAPSPITAKEPSDSFNHNIINSYETTKLVINPQSAIGWRGALSAGNSGFRINGTYDEVATGRRKRRMLERLAKKVKAVCNV